jgi:ABC-type polar amino acid transport system ATPase subunit
MNVIELENCNQFYGDSQVLHDISVKIPQKTITGVIGKSGSGKSTLLLSLSQLTQFDNGQVTILGHQHNISVTNNFSVKLQKNNIGIVFQDYALWPHMSVFENIILAPMKVLQWPAKKAWEKANQLLNTFNMLQKANSYPNQLSGGQKQKVAIIRSLIMNPKILLLDEPTAALDPTAVKDLKNIIIKLKQQGISVIIASHDISFIKSIADQFIYIQDGYIKEQGDMTLLKKAQSNDLKIFMESTTH